MTGTWKSDGDNLTLTYPTASHPDERTQNNVIRLQSRTLDFMFNGKPHLTLVKTAP
ncbi:MAG: hypothetical protein H7Y38_06715 [Armatimonadetes bacterium]|nr:hypothetical protein [Armatimonadota bacterium]